MRDRRADILDRIETILEGLSGYNAVMRNYGDAQDWQRPSIVLLDGDEDDEAIHTQDLARPNHAQPAPIIVRMMPEIFIVTAINDDPAAWGDDLNARRAALIPAIQDDETLRAMCGRNGAVRYVGCAGPVVGKRFEGIMRINFNIFYPLIPNELTMSGGGGVSGY